MGEENNKKTNEECIMNEKFDFKKMEQWKLFGVGTFRLNLNDLNKVLKDNGHTTFNENFLSIGSTHHYKNNQFIFGGDCYALVGLEDKQGSNKNYDSLFLGGYGMVKMGYDFVD